MMYRVFDIVYDAPKGVQLPTELQVWLEEDADPVSELADAVSDQTDWCVESLRFEPSK